MLTLCFHTNAQDYKSDNINYQTISWIDFFKKLDNNPELIYFDIRTEGERNDNGKSPQFNQGKIKGAIETDYFDFEKYYPEYLKHKDDTIYLYCSHSKRSRALAKQLRDSSFVKVVNINGGLSYFNSLTDKDIIDKEKYYTSSLKYKLISPNDFNELIYNKNYQIVDVRPDSLYFGKTTSNRINSLGRIKNVLHFPFNEMENNLSLLDNSKEILLFDNDGELSPIAANYLFENGYNVSILIFGLSNLVSTTASIDRSFLKTKYETISPTELLEISKNNSTVIIDVRSQSEYNGTDLRKNNGKITNAINIPLTGLKKEIMNSYSEKTIIIYDTMMQEELYKYANLLDEYGIDNFYLLSGGISQLKFEIYDLEKNNLRSLLEY